MREQEIPDCLHIPIETLLVWHRKWPALPAFEPVCVGDPHETYIREVTVLEREAKEYRAIDQLIGERDSAQSALNEVYSAIMGNAPEWSNLYGYREAISDITDALHKQTQGLNK